jgi:hypothetical protein
MIESYRFTYTASCFCTAAALDPVRVLVADGSVVAVTSLDSGEPVDPDLFGFGHPVTVEGMFSFLEEAIGADPAGISVSYHPERGFPTDARVDFEEQVADDELGFSIRGLELD